MKKVKLLMLLGIMFLSMLTVSATDYYKIYNFNYESETPSDIFAVGGECTTLSCSEIDYNDGNVEYYNLGAQSCFGDLTLSQMNSCVASYKISGNYIPSNGVIVKYIHNINENPTFIVDLHPSQDSYLVRYIKTYDIPKQYSDYMYYSTPITISFNKQPNAIAEIQELNIKNIDDPLKPIQVEVPVTIDETVCSAFTRGQPEQETYTPIPNGYSDYQAETEVNLLINEEGSNATIRNETITIPILADTCAGLSAFSWTPDSSYLNKRTTFTVTTDVTDNQASSSIQDVASVTQRVYPGDLSTSCWANSYDFKLTNLATNTELNTSIAQTTIGEYLYAISKNAAFGTNSITPMQYQIELFFEGASVYTGTFSTPVSFTEDDFNTDVINLTTVLTGVPAGIYNVTQVVTPIGPYCTNNDIVTQYQKLIVQNETRNTVTFTLLDGNTSNPLSGGNVNLELLETRDYFVIDPVYNVDRATNSAGNAVFDDVLAGDYKYTASYSNWFPSTRYTYIGSDSQYVVKLYKENQVPIINLPDELVTYYLDPETIDLTEYVDDYNDDFQNLVISANLINGTGSASWSAADDTLTFVSSVVNDAVFNVTVTDPHGASASDLIVVRFTNNHAPVISNFEAMPDNGEEPFNTIFDIAVNDLDGDSLSCTLEFGDGTNTSGSCSSLDELSHVYTQIGTYVAILTATDGIEEVEATENIYVFNRSDEAPIINSFTLDSSNGNFVPTNLTINWDVTHSSNLSMTCNLRINGVGEDVSCIGSKVISDFNVTGISRFHIIAKDSNDLQVVRSIERTFYSNATQLTDENTHLIIADVIVPGEFPFSIVTENETLARRTIEVKPIIDCGFENTIPTNDGYLLTKGVSKETGIYNVFDFKTNTNDFAGKVPTDVQCTFKVIVRDDIGSMFTLSDNVMFQYATETTKYKSIRGRGTDIVDYMSSTLMSGSVVRGYNIISFIVSNNEETEKELSISMMSQTLSLENQEELNIAPGESREVQIPFYIGESVKPGMYPVRYSVRDDEDKQTKYSYILIE